MNTRRSAFPPPSAAAKPTHLHGAVFEQGQKRGKLCKLDFLKSSEIKSNRLFCPPKKADSSLEGLIAQENTSKPATSTALAPPDGAKTRTSHALRARCRCLIGKGAASGAEGPGVRFLPGSFEVDPALVQFEVNAATPGLSGSCRIIQSKKQVAFFLVDSTLVQIEVIAEMLSCGGSGGLIQSKEQRCCHGSKIRWLSFKSLRNQISSIRVVFAEIADLVSDQS